MRQKKLNDNFGQNKYAKILKAYIEFYRRDNSKKTDLFKTFIMSVVTINTFTLEKESFEIS